LGTTPITKAELRKIIKTRLASLSSGQFYEAGCHAARQLPLIPCWGGFRSVLAFFSMKDEIDTRPVMETIIGSGKSLFVPRIEGDFLVFCRVLPPSSGVRTSFSTDQGSDFSDSPTKVPLRIPAEDPVQVIKPEDFPTLVITPGLAFDRQFRRLGRGRGYYDRFFASLDSAGRIYTALGLCMDCQLVDEVPVEAWDKRMDMLLNQVMQYSILPQNVLPGES
jgi:5-formyltetrahydrofolate cyclo-ligase